MTFAGIPVAALDFYEDLEADNSKSFWTAHKQIYEESVRTPLEALAAELEPEFGSPKLFRPYRDVRFAKDKTPYKTQQGMWFAESARYVAVSAAGLFIAGGYWGTASDQVGRLRRAVDDDVAGGQLEKIIDKGAQGGIRHRWRTDRSRTARLPERSSAGGPDPVQIVDGATGKWAVRRG